MMNLLWQAERAERWRREPQKVLLINLTNLSASVTMIMNVGFKAQERIERNKEWKRRREEAEQLGGGKDGRSKVGELQNVIIYSRIICVRSLGVW